MKLNLSTVSDTVERHLNDILGQNQPLLPVPDWQPQHCGTMDLVIKANGEWWHEGQQILRPALIDLFARVLWLEDGQYYLKTPVEKIQIQVEDVPLLIQAVEHIQCDGMDYLQFTTAQGEKVIADHQHSIEMRCFRGEWRPYIHVRWGLYALIQRSVFYHLIALGQLQENAEGDTILTLRSGTAQFTLSQPV